MKNRIGIIYGILVLMILIMGLWWVYFLTREGAVHAEFHKQRLANDKRHATFLIASNRQLAHDPNRWLSESFPHLVFTPGIHGVLVEIDPVFLEKIDREARQTRNMFLYEGAFFLLLLGAGSTILVMSLRSENRFKEARELFLAGATHEFKTPLASLRLYTETLDREGVSAEDQTNIRSRMVEDIKRLESLVNDVLAMSAEDSYTSGPRIALDLNRECRNVVDELKGVARDNGASVTVNAEGEFLVLGQRLTFALALRNLVVNAIKHCPSPVTITLNLTSAGKRHQLEVKDDGPGIPRKLQDRVFECFFSEGRVGGSGDGAGLGLYLVHRNVKSLGGEIILKSEEGQGCTFTMNLPAANDMES
jgi:signal transduction histidine kinase